jgi:hypothetical protein
MVRDLAKLEVRYNKVIRNKEVLMKKLKTKVKGTQKLKKSQLEKKCSFKPKINARSEKL